MEPRIESTAATTSAPRRQAGWVGGAVLILLGAVFLLQNFDLIRLHNWWALFILIPALANFATAYNLYRRDGRLTGAVYGALTGGLILLLVASVFLLGFDWGMVWPVFLILIGLGILVSTQSK